MYAKQHKPIYSPLHIYYTMTTTIKKHCRSILVTALMLLCLISFNVNATSVSPVSFSSLLSEQLSTEDVTEICDYYELIKVSEADSLIKYAFPTGDKVTFFMQPDKTDGTAFPKVTLKTTQNIKEIIKDIISLSYEKSSENKKQSIFKKGNLLAPRYKQCTLIKGDSTQVIYETVINNNYLR